MNASALEFVAAAPVRSRQLRDYFVPEGCSVSIFGVKMVFSREIGSKRKNLGKMDNCCSDFNLEKQFQLFHHETGSHKQVTKQGKKAKLRRREISQSKPGTRVLEFQKEIKMMTNRRKKKREL